MNRGEREARRYLEAQGLRTLWRNFRCRGGEIDLIMRDGDEIVMVEVRQRSDSDHGGALASVDGHKQRRLITAARAWQSANAALADEPIRFDVLAIEGEQPQWVRDAFQL